MGIAGYDYPYEGNAVECGRCGGTGRVYTVGRMTDGGDLTDIREVDEYTYYDSPDFDGANAGEWCRDDDRECPDCGGTGYVDRREEEDWMRCEMAEREREERLIAEYLAGEGAL